MIFAAGAVGAAAAAAGTALDLLSSLTPGKSGASKTTGVKQPGLTFGLTSPSAATPTSKPSASAAPSGPLAPSTFNALLSTQDASNSDSTSATDALKSLFTQIDGNGDGKITKGEFEDKLGAGGTNVQAADNVFSKMDADGDGSVSMNEMAAALKSKAGGTHEAHHSGGGGGADALMQALQAASSTTTTNSDGSVTTTMTYADGSKLTLSQAAPSTPSSNASSQYNLVDKMMQRQTDNLAATAKQSVSIKV